MARELPWLISTTNSLHPPLSLHMISCTVPATERCEQIAYSSLLPLAGPVLADPEPMLPRLVRGCIALAFTAGVRAVATSHRLADPVKGGELSYMALALEREPTAYRSLMTRAGVVLCDPEPMLSRLVRGCIALAFTAGVRAVATSHRLADPVKGSELSYMTLALQREPTAYRSLMMRLGAVLGDPEPMLSRLVGGCIALAFIACVLAVACSHRLADTIKGGQLSHMTPVQRCNASNPRTVRYWHVPGRF